MMQASFAERLCRTAVVQHPDERGRVKEAKEDQAKEGKEAKEAGRFAVDDGRQRGVFPSPRFASFGATRVVAWREDIRDDAAERTAD